MSNLLMDDYVGHMRVAMEQELTKNALRMSQLAALTSERKPREWEWLEDTPKDTPALSPGSLEDRTAKLQKDAKDRAAGGSLVHGSVSARGRETSTK